MTSTKFCFTDDASSAGSSQGSLKEEADSETTRNRNQTAAPAIHQKYSSPADLKLQPDRSNQSKKPAKPSPKSQRSKSSGTSGDVAQSNTASRNDARNKKNTNKVAAVAHGTTEPTFNLMTRGEGSAGEIEREKEDRKALTPPPQLEKKGSRAPAIIGRTEHVASPTSNKGVAKVVWRGQTQPRSPGPTSATPPPGKVTWDSQPTTDWDNEDIECLDDVMSSATDDDKLSESVFRNIWL